jgi:2-aminoadipate transaminase
MSFDVEPQAKLRPGIIELGWGVPDPALLPSEAIGEAAAWVAGAAGAAALSYGASEGPPVLRGLLAARIAEAEGRPIDPLDIAITGGNSAALHLLLSHLVEPGATVFMEDPGFNLAMRSVRDLRLDLVGVPIDHRGLDVDALRVAVARVRARGGAPRLLYTVATYHNPTGVSLADERRRRLVELAVEEDLLVVEDDVYRELHYDGPAPRSLWSIAVDVDGATDRVIRLGTFSKTLAPGLRCGWLTSSAARVRQFAERGVIDSGGCPSQFSACVCARFLRTGAYDPHLARLRAAYSARRDALVEGLQAELPAGCGVALPHGGFFVWVALPEGVTAGPLMDCAVAHGVSFFDGARFCLSGADTGLRLGFSMYGPDDLREGAARLGRTFRDAAAG